MAGVPHPYADFLATARVLTREELLGPGDFTPEELAEDERYWNERDREKREALADGDARLGKLERLWAELEAGDEEERADSATR